MKVTYLLASSGCYNGSNLSKIFNNILILKVLLKNNQIKYLYTTVM